MATECFWPSASRGNILDQLSVKSTVEQKDEVDSYISLFAEGYLGRGDVDLGLRRKMWDLLDTDDFGQCPPCDAVELLSEAETTRRLEECYALMPLRTPLSVFSPYICPGDQMANLQDLFGPLTGDEDMTLRTLALPWLMRPSATSDADFPSTAQSGGLTQLDLFLLRLETERQRIMEENSGMDPCELKRIIEAREEELWQELKSSDGVEPVDPRERERRLRSRGTMMARLRWKKGDEQDTLYDEPCFATEEDELKAAAGGAAASGGSGPGCTGMPGTRTAAEVACQRLVQDRVSDVRAVDAALKVTHSPSLIMEDDQGLLDHAPCSDQGLSKPPRPAKRVQDYDQDNRTEHAFSLRAKLHARRATHYETVAGNPLFCRKVVECRREPSIADMKDLVKLSHEQGRLYREFCGEMDEPPSILCSFFTKLFCPESCCEAPSGPALHPTLSPSSPCPKTKPRPAREPTALEKLVISSSLDKNTYPFTSSSKVRPRRHTIKYCWNRNNTRLQESFLV